LWGRAIDLLALCAGQTSDNALYIAIYASQGNLVDPGCAVNLLDEVHLQTMVSVPSQRVYRNRAA
jgi:hypothetical protein